MRLCTGEVLLRVSKCAKKKGTRECGVWVEQDRERKKWSHKGITSGKVPTSVKRQNFSSCLLRTTVKSNPQGLSAHEEPANGSARLPEG